MRQGIKEVFKMAGGAMSGVVSSAVKGWRRFVTKKEDVGVEG